MFIDGDVMNALKNDGKYTENQHALTVIKAEGKNVYFFDQGRSILDVLIESEMALPVHCGGGGACGGCKIRIEDSLTTHPTAVEANHLSNAECKDGIRLACQVRPQRDLKIRFINPPGELRWNTFDEEDFPSPAPHLTHPIIHTGEYRFGIAIDFGTTQIRLSLWDIHHWERVTAKSCLNPQIRFGSDILRRITTAVESESNAKRMVRLCSEIIAEAITDFEDLKGFSIEKIGPVTVVGNTAMLTILSGRNYELLLLPRY